MPAAARVLEVCLAQIKVTPAEPVATLAPTQNRRCSAGVCSGYVLDSVRARLTTQGNPWQSPKNTGPLQGLIERTFQAHLAGLGFHVSYDLLTDPNKAGLFWWKQVAWLKASNADAAAPDAQRARVCKTGWGASSTWADHPYAEARALAGGAKRRHS